MAARDPLNDDDWDGNDDQIDALKATVKILRRGTRIAVIGPMPMLDKMIEDGSRAMGKEPWTPDEIDTIKAMLTPIEKSFLARLKDIEFDT